MANNIGNINNGTWTAAANWSTGSAPTSSDNAIIESGQTDVSASYPGAGAGVDYVRFVVRENYAGTIASTGSPFYVGSITHPIYYDGRSCIAYLAIDATKSSSIDVLNTKSATNALVLSGPGTWSDVTVHAANRLAIAASSTVTNLRMLTGAANVDIAASATITNMLIDYGNVTTKSVPATRADVGRGGTLEFTSSASLTAPLINLYSGAVLKMNCGSLTITNLHLHPGASIAWSGNQLGINTITNLHIYGVGNNVQLPPNIVVTNVYYRPLRNL